jgi:hypothetical protein
MKVHILHSTKWRDDILQPTSYPDIRAKSILAYHQGFLFSPENIRFYYTVSTNFPANQSGKFYMKYLTSVADKG